MPAIQRSYLICATPRTGSNLLCEAMASAGIAGNPEEYFWQRSYWYERWGVTNFRGFMHRVLQEGTTTNGVFCSKVTWDQLKELVGELASMLGAPHDDSPNRVLEAAFPNLHYVWLRRGDSIRQGISYYRALETRRWRSTDVSNLSPDPPYNFDAIHSLIQLSKWEDEGWQAFFERHTISPLQVMYERLAEAPATVVREIIAHLGLDPPERCRASSNSATCVQTIQQPLRVAGLKFGGLGAPSEVSSNSRLTAAA